MVFRPDDGGGWVPSSRSEALNDDIYGARSRFDEMRPDVTYVHCKRVQPLEGFEAQILQSRDDRNILQRIGGWGVVRFTADLWRRSWPSGPTSQISREERLCGRVGQLGRQWETG